MIIVRNRAQLNFPSDSPQTLIKKNKGGHVKKTCSNKYVARVASKEEFKESRNQWNTLVARMRYPSVFCTWEWIQTWCKHFAENGELCIIFIERASRLVGILPLFLDRAGHADRNRTLRRVLRFCGSTHVYPDHLDIIAHESESMAILSTAFAFLTTEPIKWDVIVFSGLSEDSKLVSFLKMKKSKLSSEIREQSVAPYVRISGTFDEYLKQFGKKKRYNMKRAAKQLQRRTGATYCPGNDMSFQWLDVIVALHARRAAKKGLHSSFSTPNTLAFHRDLVRNIPSEWIFARLLTTKATPIAGFYGFRFENTLFFYQGGFDPEFATLEPGSVIVFYALEESHALQLCEFNFLQGGEAYKFKWTKSYRRLYEAKIYRKNFWGVVSHGASLVKTTIFSALKKSHERSA